jgi:hypothetical protein
LSKFTNVEKEHLKQIASDCIIQRLTTEESLLYIKDKFGLEISQDYFNHMRASLKKSAEKNLKYLQKDSFVYIQNIFFDRIQELEYMQKMLWEIVNNNGDKPNLQLSCLSELRELTVLLTNFYDKLPIVLSVHDSPIFNGQGLINGMGELPYKPDGPNDSQRKF